MTPGQEKANTKECWTKMTRMSRSARSMGEWACYRPPMTWLGLDLGQRRVGVAISDPLGSFAMPHATLEMPRSGEFPLSELLELIDNNGAEGIVVGLPMRLDGTLGPEAEAAEKFAADLRTKVELEIVMWDERLSSVEAERLLEEAGVNSKRRRAITDRVAAAVVLQSFLDSRGDPTQEAAGA
jgi:putative Holliday junction resolvase